MNDADGLDVSLVELAPDGLLDDIRKEPGADKAVQRADLNPIYAESTRWSQGAAP